jgi:hypothetical protein
MANCALVNSNDELINLIVAEPTDPVAEGFKLIEVLNGYCWDADSKQLQLIPEKK